MRIVVVIVGVWLTLGCKSKRDETCERAVDIVFKCDAKNLGGRAHDEGLRDNMLDICKEAFADDPAETSPTTKASWREVRAYAECKAKAESCEDYRRCEALLPQPGK